jgi:hypothetical protein
MKKRAEYIEGRRAFENFENALDALMKVPHSEIRAKLDAEKKEKASRTIESSDHKLPTK